MNRRQALLTLGSAGVTTATAGCIGFLTGSEALEFSAMEATISSATLDETGYEEAEVKEDVITRSFSAAGQEREVEVTNSIATYERAIDLGPLGEQKAAIFAVLSTPQVKILDRTFNPVGEMSNRELLQQLQGRYEGFSVGSRVDTRSQTVLGEDTEIEKFEASATFSGQEIDLFVHITNVAHEGDFVVPIGIYPQRLPGESEKVFSLYNGIQH